MSNSPQKGISLLEAVSIGIGGMVGGGIFAVLGLAVALAQGGTPIAFLFAGIITLITAHAYSKLSVAYPDAGGTVRFMNEGFGQGVMSGGLNNLLWVSYIIMLSLYASAFGAYAPNLLSLSGNPTIDGHIYTSLVVIVSTAINYKSIRTIGRIEFIAVFIKLLILIAFVVVGFMGLSSNEHVSQLSLTDIERPIQLLAGGMVIFVAYEGFELIANSAPEIRDGQKNIPRAYSIAVIFTICLYVSIAIVTVGSLDFASIAEAQDYVLAEAAKPTFGQVGFVVITIAALISTFSAINATLLGGSRVNYTVALKKELPTYFTHNFHGKPVGLLVITIATLVIANALNLESISTSGSIGFLIIFACVNWVSFRQAKAIKSNAPLSLIGALLCGISCIVLIAQQSQTNLTGVLVSLIIVCTCFIGEAIYRRSSDSKEH